MARSVIVHYHLFKNAGSSVETILKENFGAAWLSHDGPDPAGAVFSHELARLIGEHPDVSAVSSHQVRPPVPAIPGVEVLPVVFLRHPLDRVQSIYDFDRRRGPVTPAAELAAEHDFADYVDVLLDRPGILVRNFQVRVLTDAWDYDRRLAARLPLAQHLERALAFVDSLPAVGLVCQWDLSWSQLAPWIQRSFPDFHVTTSAHFNADPHRPEGLPERLDRLRDRLGDARYQRLEDANTADFELYERARARLGVVAEG